MLPSIRAYGGEHTRVRSPSVNKVCRCVVNVFFVGLVCSLLVFLCVIPMYFLEKVVVPICHTYMANFSKDKAFLPLLGASGRYLGLNVLKLLAAR